MWSVVDGVPVPMTEWPGSEMGMYQFEDESWGKVFQFDAAEAPQFVIFNNGQSGDGNQTADLEFVNRMEYDLSTLITVEPVDPFANMTISPAAGEVTSLKEFTLKFEGATTVDTFFGEGVETPHLVSADNTQVFDGSITYGFEADEALITLYEEVTAAGEYTLVIPAGIIEVDGVANAEMKFNYTIVPGEQTFEIFVKNVPEGFGTPYAYAWSDNAEFAGGWPGAKMQMYDLGEGVMGFTWQVTAAEAPQFIIFSNGKKANEEGAMQTNDLPFENRKVYDLTELLEEAGVITGINAVNAAISKGAVIYNLQGVRVEKAYKGGLYIVNGKKVMMK